MVCQRLRTNSHLILAQTAIYRTWFKSEGTGFADDPLTNWLVKDEDQFALFIGSDIHFVVNVLNKGKGQSPLLHCPRSS